MDIFDRNPVKCLEDVVFADYMTRQKVLAKSSKRAATNTLFFGPAGSGKTTICELLGRKLVGTGYSVDVTSINVSDYSGKRELSDAITKINGFGALNELGKIVIILEELDGAQKPAQKALKDIITKHSKTVLFFATTNDISEINEAVVDRFDVVKIDYAQPEMWQDRAVQVLANEGIKLPAVNAEKLIEIKANCESGRQIMRALDEFAMDLTMATTPNTQSKI